MPRPPRLDRPGRLHHVMNRALGKRSAFESRGDVRRFLSLLAGAVRAGRIEVHAFAILSTHFHLLLRSLDGDISEAMRLVQTEYVRWFNFRRDRDGPLFRGRFRSIHVDTIRYAQTLVRYIDQNAVEARLVADPIAYEHGSARHHAAGSLRPRWLHRELVDGLVAACGGEINDRPERYRRTFPLRASHALRRFVERRLSSRTRGDDPLDDLVGASGERVREWLHRRAAVADGTRPGVARASAQTVAGLVATGRRRSPSAEVILGRRRRRPLWDLALAALLHEVAGETQAAICRRTRSSASEVHRLLAEHRAAFVADAAYARSIAEIGRRAMLIDHPDFPSSDLRGLLRPVPAASCEKDA